MQKDMMKHLSSLTGVNCNKFRVKDKEFALLSNAFCSSCPRKCDYKNVHSYGCYESVRWDNKYIYCCPMDFTFVATPVLDEYGMLSFGIIVGPLLMGEPSDYDQTYGLPVMETSKVNDLAEITAGLFAPLTDKNKGKVGDLLNAIYRELKELPKYEPYPIEYEKKLQEAIVSGNENVAREYLNKLLGEIFFRSSGDFNVIKARVLELIVLLSRSAIEGGADSEQIFALNNGYIEEINKYDTTEKLGLWLSGIINRFIGYMFEFGDVRHSLTLRKIVMYIKSNYMRKLTLDDIADYVMLSKSHVSKIFNEEMEMSLSAYVNKVRIEKSKRLMADGALSVAQIAELVGFEEQGYFTKQFKAETGLSPKIFREKLGVIIQ